MKISEKIQKRHIISSVISLMIILLVIINIFRINYTKKESKYMAEKGVLDLRNWDIEKDKKIKLDGEWEFYSGKLLAPNEDFNKQEKEYIDVPKDWKPYLNDKGLENGSGTYRLIIKVPKDMIYAVKARTIRFSNRIYLNGDKVAQVGNPSTNKDDFESGSRYSLVVGKSINNKMEILLHVTSLNYRSGGILKSLEIGSFDSMIKADNKNLGLDALVVSVCLTLSLYFFTIYFQRNKDTYLVYFSGINLLMGLYLSTMNEQLLGLIYDYNPIGRTKLQGLLISLTSLCFLKFIHHFFKEFSNKKTIDRITTLMFLILSFNFITNFVQKPISLVVIQNIVTIGVGGIYLYIFYILIKAMRKRTDSIEYILTIVTSMSSYWIILFIKIFLEIDLGNIPIFLILIMMFSTAGLMSHQLQLDYQKANALSQKLIRDDKLKDKFLMKTSHEFKRSLNIISNKTKYLLEGKKGVLNIQQQENLFQIQQETGILKRITDNLLDASLIKNGKVSLRIGAINGYKIVDEILKEMEVLIPYNMPIILKNNISKDFPTLMADSDKFRQIIYDLVYNAIKYTESGEVVISSTLVNGQAQFKIQDTGIGIKEKYLNEIFDIFFQENKKGKSEQGLGLGLSIVKHLVEVQGGEIYVESTIGKGSSFIFTLPLYDNKDIENKKDYNDPLVVKTLEQTTQKLIDKDLRKLKEEKILIVDNEASSQRMLYNAIKELDCNIILANSGKQALEIIKKERIDLVVLDFMLSDMTSSKLCSEIRKEYSMGELPILILTASGRTIDLMSTLNYGANDFQRKPVDLGELKSRIQSLLLIKASAEEGLEKEFQYFYSQISPHFLYNTLNSIIGLSYKDSKKARHALNNLSIYLRGKLDIHRKKGFVTLESELELVTAYLEIEELRYGDKLQVVYDIVEGLNAQIPPLTLQPIVENAVYHGIASSDNNGRIKIITKKESDRYISITIQDNGKGMTAEEQKQLLKGNGKGIGFKNVMERIKILKGASLTLESNLGEGTRVKIIIPEVKNNEDDFN